MTDELEWWAGLSSEKRHALAPIFTGKDRTPLERVVAIRDVTSARAARAKEATAQAQKRTRNLVHPRTHRPNALELLARKLDWSEPTARHALYVVDAAEADPKKYGRFQKKMDEDGNVEGAYQALILAQRDERRREKKWRPPAQPVVRPGELFILGDDPRLNHRLLCGDSTLKANLDRLLQGTAVDLVLTSPPYGAGVPYGVYQDTLSNLRAILRQVPTLWHDITVPGGFVCVVVNDVISGKEAAGTEEPCIYPIMLEYYPAFLKAGFMLYTQRVLTKPLGSVSFHPVAKGTCRAVPEYDHLWTFKKPGKAITKSSKDSLRGVWAFRQEKLVPRNVHPAVMARFSAKRAIEVHSRPGSNVFEPFAGSGTVILASEDTERKCFAIELDPVYCTHAIEQWQNETSKKAVLESTGRSYDALKAERLAGRGQ